MRHRKTTPKLGRKKDARDRMLRNLVTSLFMEERVVTSHARAKAARSLAEKIITKSKNDTVHSRRLVAGRVYGAAVVKKLFNELGPRYADRPGGYTRIIKLGPRRGDAAESVVLELVDSTARSEKQK